MTQDRRKSDSDLTCIKVCLEGIKRDLEHVKSNVNCRELEGKIIRLETKQRLVQWIGGTIAVTWLGAVSKWVSQHIR